MRKSMAAVLLFGYSGVGESKDHRKFHSRLFRLPIAASRVTTG